MTYRIVTLKGTTDASGDLTLNDTSVPIGRVEAVVTMGGLDAGGTFTLTTRLPDQAGTEEAVDTIINAVDIGTAANNSYLPRKQVVNNAATGLTYDGTRVVSEPFVCLGSLRAVIASGGNAKSVRIRALIRED